MAKLKQIKINSNKILIKNENSKQRLKFCQNAFLKLVNELFYFKLF